MTLIRVEEGDISAFAGDAVVNAANNHLVMGAGVAGAIRARGGGSIQEECDAYVRTHGPIAVGEAVVTGAGTLPSRFVIHAAAMGDEPASDRSIASATSNALTRALEVGARSVALPVLGAGIGGFAFDRAARIMLDQVRSFVALHPGSLDSVVFFGYLPDQATALRRLLD